jgi:pimeloyl-ACP methyl ester carboxylesterase
MNGSIRTDDGRTVGFEDFGPSTALPVLWCHGGPGSRLEPAWLQHDAADAGLRLVGVDRPGYGTSTPRPGRTIADVVPDLIHVADHLGIDKFAMVGVSTGGAYAFATAAIAPERLLGVLACGAMTDMSWPPGRATMHGPQVLAVWDAPDRDHAIDAATDAYGEGFGKLLAGGMNAVLAPSDAEIFADPTWMDAAMAGFPEMSTHGLQGYADDRIADGPGWTSFDIAAVTCPVEILHGDRDQLVDVIQAEYTARLVPRANLVIIPEAGHFSIERHVVPELDRLLGGPSATQSQQRS